MTTTPTVPSADDYRNIGALIRQWRRPLVLTHARPDGDALGALVAMSAAYRGWGTNARALLFDRPTPRYAWLAGDPAIELWIEEASPNSDAGAAAGRAKPSSMGSTATRDTLEGVDGVLVLDTCSYSQLEPAAQWLRSLRADRQVPIVVLDHHVTRDDLADHYLIDPAASAACALLYDWFTACGWPIDFKVAEALYVGLATDTGWFRFSNTNAHSLEIAADLVRRGVRPEEYYRRIHQTDSPARIRLLGHVLAGMELGFDQRLALMTVGGQTFAELGAAPSDTEDLINEPLRIASVELAILLTEAEPGLVKASFRSKRTVDVAALAGVFGGGGHVRAAGARFKSTLAAARKQVLEALERIDWAEETPRRTVR